MTSYKPYNPNQDPRSKIIEIGIQIATKAHHEYEYGHLTPIHTRIIFGHIDRSDYSTETIHQIMKEQGFNPNCWYAQSVWQTSNDNHF